jgi:hypothetical protein
MVRPGRRHEKCQTKERAFPLQIRIMRRFVVVVNELKTGRRVHRDRPPPKQAMVAQSSPPLAAAMDPFCRRDA